MRPKRSWTDACAPALSAALDVEATATEGGGAGGAVRSGRSAHDSG